MNNLLKVLLVLAVAAGLVFAAMQMFGSNDDLGGGYGEDPIEKPVEAPDKNDEPKTGTMQADEKPAKPPVEPATNTQRVEVSKDDQSGKEFAQGIKGQLVDPAGYAVPGAKVYLMPALGVKHAFELMRQHEQGRIFPPVAQSVSDDNGRFSLGVERIDEDNHYEVRILHDKFCDHKMPNIRFTTEGWTDVGRVALKRGVVVTGRVLVRGTGFPVKDAMVSIGTPNGLIDIAPAPGRENGITVSVDAAGNYRIENIDPIGVFKMTAVAPNYAKQEQTDLSLETTEINRVNFELTPGYSITGIVTGPSGKPIPRAKITAYALSEKASQVEETRSDDDGSFNILGLRQGSFTIVAEAPGFSQFEDKPIPAGKKDFHITMERQGRARVQVFAKTGRPMHRYQVWLKSYFEGQTVFGNTPVYKNVARSSDGSCMLEGIDPGDYVVEVQAKAHCKAFSQPFKILEGQEDPPRVEVRMTEGGVIAGVVVNAAGRPLKGVLVKTRPNKLVDNVLIQMFQVPYRITKTQTTTNDKGEFRIALLNSGNYQLRFEHRQYCTKTTNDNEVVEGETKQLGQIKLVQGAVLTGTVRVNGRPKGQVKVQVSAVAEEGKDPVHFSVEAITDNTGKFTMPKRLPPGKYEAYAAEQIQNNPFLMIVQMQKSKKEFTVGASQKARRLQIDLRKDGNF